MLLPQADTLLAQARVDVLDKHGGEGDPEQLGTFVDCFTLRLASLDVMQPGDGGFLILSHISRCVWGGGGCTGLWPCCAGYSGQQGHAEGLKQQSFGMPHASAQVLARFLVARRWLQPLQLRKHSKLLGHKSCRVQ